MVEKYVGRREEKYVDPDPFDLQRPRDEKKEITADFRILAKSFAFDALMRIEERALSSNEPALRQRCDEFLVGYGFSKPQEVTATVNARVDNRYSVVFQLSDLAPKGSYIESSAADTDESA